MPTRPTSPDPSGSADASNPFASLNVAGLGFFQDWMKAASSALPNLGGNAASAGAAWAMPTLDPEELDKRIQDLKTVQFWLEQNARMIGMTIQTLEVQRMTLQTLKGMKVPLDTLRESLQAQAMPTAPTPSPAEAAPPSDDALAAAAAVTPPPGVNPMQWWSTLTEQFSNLASQAVQAGSGAMAAHASAAPAAAASSAKPPKATTKTKGPERSNPTGQAGATGKARATARSKPPKA